MNDLISRQKVLQLIRMTMPEETSSRILYQSITQMESSQIESLNDKEKRIFLGAIGREERICKEIDENLLIKVQYEDSLVRVCREIVRKVKGALWGN